MLWRPTWPVLGSSLRSADTNALEADKARMYRRRDLQRLDVTHGRVEHMDQSLPWWSARARCSHSCNAYARLLLLLHVACAICMRLRTRREHIRT